MSEDRRLEDERKEWEAIRDEPRLDLLPAEALIASNRYLAGRLLEKTEPLTFEAWLHQGIEAGYCTEAVCHTHDGLTFTPAEDAEFEAGGEPCVPAVRLWPEADEVHQRVAEYERQYQQFERQMGDEPGEPAEP